MSDVRSCGQCGVILPADSPHGVCPSCLMRVGLGARDATGTLPHAAGGRSFVPPKPHELSVHFPQLEILDLIGQGGMGAVYKARQVSLDRIVALKVLPPHAGDDGSFAGRFEREARALARLSHPNIVAVYDSGRAGDFYYFVMEYVDGVNLREAIRAGALAPAEALAIVPQICDALQYAHDAGIVHRDIKPENVLIDKKGNAKIADFGLARLLGPTTDLTLTGTHQVMGTPRYMAPEQMEGSHEVDHRADIYSLGVVFYEMLTGELPLGRFDGPSKKVQIDVRLDEVVFRTLEKEPARRYQHASDVKTDVQTICGLGGGLPTRGATFYEYKSKTHLFGWPLVHIANGTDPRTGKLMRARGIIAIGNIAYGVIAIGSFAVGGIAVGACAVGGLAVGGGAIGSLALGGGALGLFSFGGLAIGLLLANGGLALGLGWSTGGLAVGAVAKGGVAIGWYADAGYGLAYGIHALGSNVVNPDAAAQRMFVAERSSVWYLLVFTGVAVVTMFVGLLVSLRVLGRRQPGRGNDIPPKVVPPKKLEPSTHGSNSALVVAVVVILCLVAMCSVPLLVGLSYVSLEQRPSVPSGGGPLVTNSILAESLRPQAATTDQIEVGDAINGIIWTEDGPTLDPELEGGAPRGRLSTDQLLAVNQILGDAHRAYLEIERENITQTHNAAGHWVTTVNIKDPNQLAKLENQLWTKIDAVVDVSWQSMLRSSLWDLKSSHDVGVLGFAGRQGTIEIWKVGSWYHWKVTPTGTPTADSAETGIPDGSAPRQVLGSGPQLPIRYRRFWTEPAADSAGNSP